MDRGIYNSRSSINTKFIGELINFYMMQNIGLDFIERKAADNTQYLK